MIEFIKGELAELTPAMAVIEAYGVGFDVSRPVAAGPAGGYGLRALRERFAELGGGVEVESEPGGTAVALRLPLIAAVESSR